MTGIKKNNLGESGITMKIKKILKIITTILCTIFFVLIIVARKTKKDSVYDNASEEKNPMEGKKVIFIEDENDKENADGVKGHLEVVGETLYKPGIYDKYVKRAIDIILSFAGLVVLSPVFLILSLAIIIEDPGPVLFTQKRLGQNKQYFKLHKFRSMKVSTPHDVPTHMLDNPDQYITKVGRFIRAHSLDELPQIWDIFVGNLSTIGPRPALWNQDVLVAEREKYGANEVKPGLTGWAQINGRDELEIAVKAKLDGEYVQKESFLFDLKCFLGTIGKVVKDDSVLEGGTGDIKKEKKLQGRDYANNKLDKELIGKIGFGEAVFVDRNLKRKVLVTGTGSYIGESFKAYVEQHYKDNFEVEELDMLNPVWRKTDFSKYDIIFHVAGIAHADVGNVSADIKEKYYAVNTDLAIEVAQKAKNEGVKEFVFMSSMIIYGESAPYGKKKIIDEDMIPNPANFYGDSKFQADVGVRELANDTFKVIVLRPPMIYGKGSKGNYPILAKLAKILPIFPDVNNARSMIYIDNLCEFLGQIMLIREIKDNAIVLIPQNREWTKTSQMVKEIAKILGRNIHESKCMSVLVAGGSKIPGKIGVLVNKAFGNSCYAHEISVYEGINYQITSFKESIQKTEGKQIPIHLDNVKAKKPKALIVASVASMIEQFNMQNIQLLLDNGYDVDVVCNCKVGNTISDERVQDLISYLAKKGVSVIHVPIPRKISDVKGIIDSLLQVKKLCDKNIYKILHCHSPIGSVVARLAAKESREKNGTKVIYTAHGFHFYKGAPKQNWIIFYPIERVCAKLTDVLITINKEDYEFAKGHMKAGKVVYIPGVGIDTTKFKLEGFDKAQKRAEIGISENDIMIISVGELNQNKNHEVIVKAISKLEKEHIHYFIAGRGNNEHYLRKLSVSLGVHLHLLGYRTDVIELLNTADIFALPSLREGLSVALMEAMAAGLPCIVSKIRGNVDLIEEKKGGYLCKADDIDGFADSIEKLIEDRMTSARYNQNVIKKFDVHEIMKLISQIYGIE